MGYRRVGLIGQYFSENEYANYLFYKVSKRFNNLLPQQNPYNYSSKQIENYKLIKSLHKGGLGYRKIAQILNYSGIKTKNDKEWTNGLVHSVLKRYAERQARLERQSYTSEMKFSKMKLEWLRD